MKKKLCKHKWHFIKFTMNTYSLELETWWACEHCGKIKILEDKK